jgi:hypothetical protein
MADVVNFTEFRAGQQPVKDNEEGCRSDDAYIEAMFNSARAQLTDTMEIDLGRITQENDSITIEDMIRCQIAGLSKFLRDYLHQLYPAKGWIVDAAEPRSVMRQDTRAGCACWKKRIATYAGWSITTNQRTRRPQQS